MTPDRTPIGTSADEILSAKEEHREPPHERSLTAVATEAAATGVKGRPTAGSGEEIPGEDARLSAGDPDVDPLDNEYSGDEIPGGSSPSPDQNNVDEIGRAYGVSNLDDGSLVSPEDLLEKRDQHRWELDPRSKDPQP
jgi:hypothetical protein